MDKKYYMTSALLTKGSITESRVSIHYGESVDAVKTIAVSEMSDLFGAGYRLSTFDTLMIPIEISPVNADVSAIVLRTEQGKVQSFFFDLEKDSRPELEADLHNLIAKHYSKNL